MGHGFVFEAVALESRWVTALAKTTPRVGESDLLLLHGLTQFVAEAAIIGK